MIENVYLDACDELFMSGKTILIDTPVGQFHKELNQQLAKIDDMLIKSEGLNIDPNDFRDDLQRWSDFTNELLLSRFRDDRLPQEFAQSCRRLIFTTANPIQNLKDIRSIAQRRRNALQSIVDRRGFFQFSQVEKALSLNESADIGRQVFIVHGHRDDLKHAAARVIDSVRLEPIILSEQPNEGRTIIEKLEHSSKVAFAVILLTADDEGGVKNEVSRPRARQNVILELGYFVGRIGRGRVCAIYEHGVEVPSDILGVVYVPYDAEGAWKFRLLSEFKAAGLKFDANQAL